MSGIKQATRIQIGKETNRGDEVNATRRLTAAGTYRRIEEFEAFEDDVFGVLARTARAPVKVRQATEFEYRAPLSFQEVLIPLLTGLKGGVTGVGAGADKTWTFTPGVATDPLPDTYTLEFEEADMAAAPNVAELQALYCFCTGFEIAGGLEKLPEMTVSMVGRATNEGSKTPGLGLPSLTHAANLLWTVYIDSSWAGLGGTQISAQILSFRLRGTPGLRPASYLDGRSGLDFSKYEFSKRSFELELEVVHAPAAGSLVQTEETNKSTPALRFVELRLTGAALGGSNYSIKLQGAYYHADDSMQERGTDRDGNMITRLHLFSAYDPVGAQDIKAIVVNDIAAFP